MPIKLAVTTVTNLFWSLWRTRARPSFASRKWFILWLKRIRLGFRLVQQVRLQATLRRRGASIGEFVHVSSIERIRGRFANLSVGNESAIGCVELALHDQIKIGNRVCINDGVRLLTGSHSVACANWKTTSAPIIIDDYAWIATDAILLPGVHVGRGAVVGAGAVVAKSVPAGAIAVGNPAVILSSKRAEDLNYTPVGLTALFNAWRSDSAPLVALPTDLQD